MVDVVFSGSAGRLEGKYQQGPHNNSPVVIVLHPDPKGGGTMNTKVVYALYRTFVDAGFSALRFNFRGVGKSEGTHDMGEGELSDAAAALDWIQTNHPHVRQFWVAGFSFGAWIAMQLLMRRPELGGFIAVSPPANRYDFSFLSPCPVSGQIIQGTQDTIVPKPAVDLFYNKLKLQKGIHVDYEIIPEADHFFVNQMPTLVKHTTAYIKKRCPDLTPVSLV